MYKIDNIKCPLNEKLTKKHIAKTVKINQGDISSFKIIKKAIDARKKSNVHYVYSVLADTKCPLNLNVYEEKEYIFPKGNKPSKKPVVVGSGPAGLFAALMLAQNGYEPILLEQGADVDSRKRAVSEYWNGGKLDVRTNVQFGEGGAGTFSDGKLNSGIHDPRCRYVLQTFAKMGAPESITYEAKPHIGTDILCEVIKNVRFEIENNGGKVLFLTKLTDIIIEKNSVCGAVVEHNGEKRVIDTDCVILAIGHSARDTYKMLYEKGIKMEQKNFSVGVRIEHKQKMINESQYGEAAELLGAADYKLSAHFDNGRSAYTFCMCPGGFVVASASEDGTIVTNGMSNSERDGENANSALLVNVTTDDFENNNPLSGMYFQEKIEKNAYNITKSNFAPCQYVGDFLDKDIGEKVSPTYRPGVEFCDISKIFPSFVNDTLKLALEEFDKKINGFASGGAVMTAPETRSSAPLRILRDKETMCSAIKGLYPCGEGAGYAGGIMSAAVDGIKVSEAVVKAF